MDRPEGYPEVVEADSGASFMGTKNDMSQLESGLLRRNYSDVGGNHYRFRSNVNVGESSVDQKLLALVAFFRELYFRRLELFKKIFPDQRAPDDHRFLAEMPKRLNLVLSQLTSDRSRRVRTMQRSLSIGSPREFKRDESEMRLERFKVRTIDVDDDVEQDKPKSGGSK